MKGYSFSITLFFISICSFNVLFAQKVNWSEVHKKNSLFSIVYPVSMTDKEYFVLSRPKKNNEVLIYDHNHKLLGVKQVSLGRDKEGAVMTEVFETSSGSYVIYNWRNKARKLMEIYAAPFSNGKIGKAKKIHSHDFKTKGSFAGMLNLATIMNAERFGGLIQSTDKSKVAYVSYTSSETRKGYDELSIAVFDQDLNMLWKKTKDFPYKDKNFSITQVLLNNEGEIFVSAAILKKNAKSKEPSYGFKIFEMSDDIDDEFGFELKDNSFPYTIGLSYENNNQLNIAGTYTSGEYKGRLTGFFFGKLNIGTGDFQSKVYPFEKSFLEGLISDRKIEKGKGLEDFYSINYVVRSADGTYSLLAEKYYIKTRQRNVNGRWESYTIYHSDELIIPRFSSDGELLHMEKIDKDFNSSSSMFTSYRHALKDNKIILIYNDNKKRKERKESGTKKNALFTDITIIGDDGKIESQKTLFTSKGDDVESLFCPQFTLTHKNKFLLYGFSGIKKYQFGILEL